MPAKMRHLFVFQPEGDLFCSDSLSREPLCFRLPAIIESLLRAGVQLPLEFSFESAQADTEMPGEERGLIFCLAGQFRPIRNRGERDREGSHSHIINAHGTLRRARNGVSTLLASSIVPAAS